MSIFLYVTTSLSNVQKKIAINITAGFFFICYHNLLTWHLMKFHDVTLMTYHYLTYVR